MCNPYKDWDQKIITFSPLKPIRIFRSHRSHGPSRKGRDFAALSFSFDDHKSRDLKAEVHRGIPTYTSAVPLVEERHVNDGGRGTTSREHVEVPGPVHVLQDRVVYHWERLPHLDCIIPGQGQALGSMTVSESKSHSCNVLIELVSPYNNRDY